MEVPKLRVESELRLPVYVMTTANQIQAMSVTYTTAHRQHRILNPLSKARDWTLILMDAIRVLNLLSCNRNSRNQDWSNSFRLKCLKVQLGLWFVPYTAEAHSPWGLFFWGGAGGGCAGGMWSSRSRDRTCTTAAIMRILNLVSHHLRVLTAGGASSPEQKAGVLLWASELEHGTKPLHLGSRSREQTTGEETPGSRQGTIRKGCGQDTSQRHKTRF